jgi:hypothetical protein
MEGVGPPPQGAHLDWLRLRLFSCDSVLLQRGDRLLRRLLCSPLCSSPLLLPELSSRRASGPLWPAGRPARPSSLLVGASSPPGRSALDFSSDC